MSKKLIVTAQWDEEAGVWVATSNDIPGLVSEAKSLDLLVERILEVAPELLEENAHLLEDKVLAKNPIDVCVMSRLPRAGYHAH